jgi:hypothetical protein
MASLPASFPSDQQLAEQLLQLEADTLQARQELLHTQREAGIFCICIHITGYIWDDDKELL